MGGLGVVCISLGIQHFGWSRLIPLLYAIAQARNTFAISAACFAWVLVTVLVVWLGKWNLLFRFDFGLTKLPCLLCTT